MNLLARSLVVADNDVERRGDDVAGAVETGSEAIFSSNPLYKD